MNVLDVLAVTRRLRPRLTAILIASAFYFLPQLSTAVIMQAAQERARTITTLFTESLASTFSDSRSHRHKR